MFMNFEVIGRLVRDAEMKQTKTGKTNCSFTVACDVGYGDNKKSEFVRFTLWDKTATGLSPYLKKGTQVFVSAESVSANAYINKDGEAAGSLEGGFVKTIKLLGSKKDSDDTAPKKEMKAPKKEYQAPEHELEEAEDEDAPW